MSPKFVSLSDMSSSRYLNDDGSSSPSNSPVKKQLDFTAKIRLIPEGGWGWMICAAAFGTQLIVMGIHNSFGILYTTLLEEYKKTKAETGTQSRLFTVPYSSVRSLRSSALPYGRPS